MIPREGDDKHGLLLASGGREPQEGEGDLGEDGEDSGTGGGGPESVTQFYIAVTQQVLLFGAESWVLTKRMEAALDALQGRVARRLTG